jgi:16S rRNA U516 pseudouridylate synthase RsuA-like enzyme
VLKLHRVAIGFLRHETLKPGEFRHLRDVEVKRFLRSP